MVVDLVWMGVVLAFVATAACWGLAPFVYLAGPTRGMNRALAASLILEGMTMGSGFGAYPLADAPSQRGFLAVNFVCALAASWTYLLFLGTLDAPLARPLGRRPVRVALILLAVGTLPVALLFPEIVSMETTGLGFVPWLVFMLSPTIGLLVSISAYRHARPASLARTRAKMYVLAFGTRDIVYVGLASGYAFGAFTVLGIPIAVYRVGFPLGTLLFACFLGYGILKSQLFDIDLKLKWTIKQSTVAAVFVGAFFIVSESDAAFFSDAIGTYAGIAAAGLLVLALAPLQRAAERLSDKAMPGVEATPAYAAFRKMEVYKAAVEEVVADGLVSEKDRRVLERLRAQLGLTADDAHAMERDAQKAQGAT